jgi:TolB-like protein/cytochrome c-type biogenesis protein CcmH/NrfG
MNDPSQFSQWLDKFKHIKHIKGIIVALAGGGAVLSGLVGYWTTYQTFRDGATSSITTARPANRSALSILVLPFSNQTGDVQKAYIADALTTSMTSDLSRIRDAFVIPTATALIYKDKAMAVQQVGKDAGVRFVLQGGVLSSGETIRISVQLADTQTGAQLWSETFTGELTNLFALQDKVTTAVVNSIGREMVVVVARESEMRKSTPKAADLMLQARALNLKPQSLKNHQQAEDWYRQVLMLEPNNAGAIFGLGRALTLQAFNFGRQLPPDVKEQKFSEGRELNLKSKELDPNNPNIQAVMALYAATHNDYDGQLRASEAWLALAPKDPMAYNFVAGALLGGGKSKQATEFLKQAIELDKKNPSELILLGLTRAHFASGDYDAAIAWGQRALQANRQLTDTYPYLAMAYALKGDTAKARTTVAELLQINPNFKLMEFRKPMSSSPAAYKEWFEKKYLPAARKAGLPE